MKSFLMSFNIELYHGFSSFNIFHYIIKQCPILGHLGHFKLLAIMNVMNCGENLPIFTQFLCLNTYFFVSVINTIRCLNNSAQIELKI